MKHFKGFGKGFTKLHAKLDAETLLAFSIYRRQNETRSRKNTPVKTTLIHNMVSRGRLMEQALGRVTLASASHLLSPRQLQELSGNFPIPPRSPRK
jgi:hypothetical protein